MSRTSFGDEEFTEPSALTKCSNDALVDEGVEAPKPRLSPVEIRTPTPPDGLLPAESTPTTVKNIFSRQPLPWIFGEKTDDRSNGTSTRRENVNQLAPSCRWKTVKSESRRNLVFDPGGNVQVVCANVYFWEGGTRCFAGKVIFGRREGTQPGA